MGNAKRFARHAGSIPALPAHQSYKSALVFVPSVDPKVEEVRNKYDKRYHRWMPHITILFPFVPEEYNVSDGRDDVLAKVQNVITKIPQTAINFQSLGHFSHSKNSHTLYLAPDEGATKVLKQIVHDLIEALPEYNDVLHEGNFTPHITLGQFRSLEQLKEIQEMVEEHLKTSKQSSGTLNELSWVTRRGYADRMSPKKTFSLAPTNATADITHVAAPRIDSRAHSKHHEKSECPRVKSYLSSASACWCTSVGCRGDNVIAVHSMFRRLLGSSPPAKSLASLDPEERQIRLLESLKGMEMVMNDDMTGAEIQLARHDDAFHDTGVAVSIFIRAMLGFEKKEIAASTDSLEKALHSCEAELTYSKHLQPTIFPPGAEYNVCIGNILLQLCLSGFMAASIPEAMKAVIKLRRSYNIFHSLHAHMQAQKIQIDLPKPVLKDNGLAKIDTQHMRIATGQTTESGMSSTDYFIACATLSGYGLLSLTISLIPQNVSRILSMIGFKGNREESLAILFSVADAPNIHGAISLLALLTYYSGIVAFCDIAEDETGRIARLDECSKITEARYPDSAVWKLQRARMQGMKGDLTDSIQTLEAIDVTQSQMKQIQMLKMYDLGFAYLSTLQWEKAADQFAAVERVNDWSKGLYFYVIGACQYEVWRETKAAEAASVSEEAFAKVMPLLGQKKVVGRELPLEVYFRRKLRKWSHTSTASEAKPLVTGITGSPILEFCYLFNLTRRMDNGLLQRALDRLNRDAAATERPDEAALRAVLTANLLRHLGRFDEAIALLAPVPDTFQHGEQFAETWVLPWARYEEAAAVFFGRRDLDRVRMLIEAAKRLAPETELEQRLALKLSTATQLLDKM